jgi:3-oxoacyl-[acyl-carrier-protein] synthase II
MGCVTPIGIGRQAYWSALSKGESGVRRIEAFDEQTFAPRFAIVSALDLRIAPW